VREPAEIQLLRRELEAEVPPARRRLRTQPALRRSDAGARTARVGRARPGCFEVNDPGIPGADNWWCPSAGEARAAALRRASQLGTNYGLVHDSRPTLGRPHFHILDPQGDRVSGHFFYGGRPPRRMLRGRPSRESEYEAAKDHFVIETRTPWGSVFIPEGHEVLTRRAAAGLPFTAAQVNTLVEGVRRVDTVPISEHFNPAQQMRHALRRDLCTSMGAAITEIRNHLRHLHRTALASAPAVCGFMGEALHLIQDSFSEAHTQRLWSATGPPHRIQFIRYFGPRGRTAPDEHQVFPTPDPRDIITAPGGALRFAAARSVEASREFLIMMLRHLAAPGAPGITAEVNAYLVRHLALSATPREPRSLYPGCP
jgi:hypothetical protein